MELPYRMLVLDLDGTALGKDPAQFAPGVLAACEAAAAKGVEVVFATGRPCTHLPPDVRPGNLPWLRYLILNDGAQVWDWQTGECLWLQEVPPDALDRVAAVGAQYAVPVEYIDAAGLYHVPEKALEQLLDEGTPVSDFHRNILRANAEAFTGSPAQFAPEHIVKINTPCVPSDRWDAVCAALEAAGVLPMECCAGALEITSPKAGKREAVRFAAQRLGFGLDAVMALGDSGNDAALLKAAGLGIAMGNASAVARHAADAVTAANYEGGAALAIRKWLLA